MGAVDRMSCLGFCPVVTGPVNQPLWLIFVGGGLDGGVIRGDMGREKLIDARSDAVEARDALSAAPAALRSPDLLEPGNASLAARLC